MLSKTDLYSTVLLLTFALCSCATYNYPKASSTADSLISLDAIGTDTARVHFYVDRKKVGVGKVLKAEIDDRKEHHVVAWPEGYRWKEDFIQPPYANPNRLSFTFMIGDKETSNQTPPEELPESFPKMDGDTAQPNGVPTTVALVQEQTRQDSSSEGPTVIPPTIESGRNGVRWGVIVGVSDYKDSRIPSLRYAAADARALYDWMVSPTGGCYAPERVKLLLNEQATARTMREALFKWLKQALEEDLVVIYFAGHGTPESPDAPDNLFLLPYDAEYDNVATTAFPMWDIGTALKRYIAAKKVVVMADACHAGGVGKAFSTTGRRAVETADSNRIAARFEDLSKVAPGVCVVSASSDRQLSREGLDWGGGHGVFTHFLLEGLKGGADYNGDDRISLGEIIPFLSEQVRRGTESAQSPVVSGSFDPALCIGK